MPAAHLRRSRSSGVGRRRRAGAERARAGDRRTARGRDLRPSIARSSRARRRSRARSPSATRWSRACSRWATASALPGRATPWWFPFQVSCGECSRCLRGLTESCKRGGMYGHRSRRREFGGGVERSRARPLRRRHARAAARRRRPATAASAPQHRGCVALDRAAPARPHRAGDAHPGRPGANSIPLYGVQIAQASGAETVTVLTNNADTAAKAQHLGA